MANMALSFNGNDIAKIKKGSTVVLETLKQCADIKVFVDSMKEALDGTTNKTLIDLSNKLIPQYTQAKAHLVEALAVNMNQVVDTAFKVATTCEDVASAAEAKKLYQQLEGEAQEVKKIIKKLEGETVVIGTGANSKPLDFNVVIEMVTKFQAMSKYLNETYTDITKFNKQVESTQLFGAVPSLDDTLKTLKKEYKNITNDEVIPVVEESNKNFIDFLEGYKDQMNQAQRDSLAGIQENSKKFATQISSVKENTKKTKAQFGQKRSLFGGK